MRIFLALLMVFVFSSFVFAHDMLSLGEWDGLVQKGDRLEEVKRIKKLELEILELEKKQEKMRHKEGLGIENTDVPTIALPRVHGIFAERNGVLCADLLFPDGKMLRVHPKTSLSGMTIVSISRDRVLAFIQGKRQELPFER